MTYRERIVLAGSEEEVFEILKDYHREVQNSEMLVGIVAVAEHTVALLIILRMISDKFEDLDVAKETIAKAAPYYREIFEITEKLKKRIKVS